MLKGFRDFIMKGNVVDLATAVIIATAFTAIVTAFTDGIIKPIINTIPWSPNEADGLGFELVSGKSSTFVNIGGVLTAVINFLIIAFVVFLLVKGVNKIKETAMRKEEAQASAAGPSPALARASTSALRGTLPSRVRPLMLPPSSCQMARTAPAV